LKEGSSERVFGNRVPRIFGLRGEGVTGEWKRLNNEELCDLDFFFFFFFFHWFLQPTCGF
jgi:hypothetical protein